MFHYTDTHAHITYKNPPEERIDEIIKNAKENNVQTIINVSTNIKELKQGLIISKKYPFIYNAAATTPHDVKDETEETFLFFEKCAKENKLIAIGEIGLDYHYHKNTKDLQEEVFKKYLKLAEKFSLPVIIHCREAFLDFFEIISNFKVKCVMHCFTGNINEAKQALDLGFFISFSGILTYKNSHELRKIAKEIPIEKILIETDSPYLAPQSKRGKTNEPAYIVETAKTLSEIKNIPIDQIANITTNNSKILFKF